MAAVFCFGELLLRYSPVLNGEWIYQSYMPVFVGGAELNVARALARWQVPVSYGTALPNNDLTREIIDFVRSEGIDIDSILLSGSRIGTYYLPQGADLKNAGVIYDRANSSFYDLKPGQIDWDTILAGKTWFHFSAISPALNENVALVCKEGLQVASNKGLTISVDLNYRSKLWQWGKEAIDVMPDLVQYCDIVMGNIWAAEKMLGVKLPNDFTASKENFVTMAESTAKAICSQFKQCRQVANTFRFDEADGQLKYYATLFQNGNSVVSNTHHTAGVIDKVGSGDCFMAGLIYGNLSNMPAQEIIEFAAAAAFSKLFVKGDATTQSVQEIKEGYLNDV